MGLEGTAAMACTGAVGGLTGSAAYVDVKELKVVARTIDRAPTRAIGFTRILRVAS
jgi:hypothetical protein